LDRNGREVLGTSMSHVVMEEFILEPIQSR